MAARVATSWASETPLVELMTSRTVRLPYCSVSRPKSSDCALIAGPTLTANFLFSSSLESFLKTCNPASCQCYSESVELSLPPPWRVRGSHDREAELQLGMCHVGKVALQNLGKFWEFSGTGSCPGLRGARLASQR